MNDANVPSRDSPIYKLDGHLLWWIFTINAAFDEPVSDPVSNEVLKSHYSPLTSTRCCSQVCSLWRNIILESPSLWSSIDLNSLAQKDDTWRNEVLRRSQDALLIVKGQCTAEAPQSFFRTLLRDYLPRVKVIDVIMYPLQFRDEEVIEAIGRPAPNLTVFVTLSETEGDISPIEEEGFPFPPNFSLFAGAAPSLHRVSIGEDTLNVDYDQIISMLSTTPLRYLKLNLGPLKTFRCAEVLRALSQMIHLEFSSVSIDCDILDAPYTASFRAIHLPKLMMIEISCVQSPGIYYMFLNRIFPHPGCVFRTYTGNHSAHTITAQEYIDYAEGAYSTITRYGNSFFDSNLHSITSVSISRAGQFLCFGSGTGTGGSMGLNAAQNIQLYTSTQPDCVLDSFANAISSLRFPKSITKFESFFVYPEFFFPYVPSFQRLYISLESITILRTTPKDLTWMMEGLPEGVTLFPALLHIRILAWNHSLDDHMTPIKNFLVHRQHRTAVLSIRLPQSWTLSDLRTLEDFSGLTVLLTCDREGDWAKEGDQQPQLLQYVCGGISKPNF